MTTMRARLLSAASSVVFVAPAFAQDGSTDLGDLYLLGEL